jgi:hypothetical protein
LSGARGGDIEQFVDGVDTVVGELPPRCGASSAELGVPTEPRAAMKAIRSVHRREST